MNRRRILRVTPPGLPAYHQTNYYFSITSSLFPLYFHRRHAGGRIPRYSCYAYSYFFPPNETILVSYRSAIRAPARKVTVAWIISVRNGSGVQYYRGPRDLYSNAAFASLMNRRGSSPDLSRFYCHDRIKILAFIYPFIVFFISRFCSSCSPFPRSSLIFGAARRPARPPAPNKRAAGVAQLPNLLVHARLNKCDRPDTRHLKIYSFIYWIFTGWAQLQGDR